MATQFRHKAHAVTLQVLFGFSSGDLKGACKNATVVCVHIHQAWCKCWVVAQLPVVPGGFCFTMSQLVEDSSADIEDSLNAGSCIPSEGLLADRKGGLWVTRHQKTKVEHSNAIWESRMVSFDLSWKSHHGHSAFLHISWRVYVGAQLSICTHSTLYSKN